MAATEQRTNTAYFARRTSTDRIDTEAFERMKEEVEVMRRRVAVLDAHTSARLTAQAKRMDSLNRRLAARLIELETRVGNLEGRDGR
jgi:hypothetical protein